MRRFTEEVLGGSVEPITLSCIEKGTRFPTQALVRCVAAARKEDPQGLLALLWRDRKRYAFANGPPSAQRGLGEYETSGRCSLIL